MKSKQILILTSIFLSLVILLNLASAALTTNIPASGTNWTTTVNFNCTKLTGDAPVNALNATLYYNTTSTAMAALAGSTVANNTAADIDFAVNSVSITSLTDASNYNFKCVIRNATAEENSTATTGITIDDTTPTCTSGASLIQRKNIEQGATNTLTCACTDNIDTDPIATTTRTLTKPGATTVTISSSPYTAKGSDVNKLGVYTFSCLGTDYTGNSVTNTNTFRVDSDDNINPISITIPDQQKKRNTNILLIAAGLIVIIGVMAVVFAFMSKKK